MNANEAPPPEADDAEPAFTTTDEPPPETAAEAIARLAKLDPLEYEQIRVAEAERLGFRVSSLDSFVQDARPKSPENHGKSFTLADPEPWPDVVSLPHLLADLEAAILRHMSMPRASAVCATLWVAHTWAYQRFEFTPRLAIISPLPRCGKSTLLAIIAVTASRPFRADNISASGTFRTIEALAPLTLLLDEADSYLGENEELRGVLNSGYERGGCVVRTVEIKDVWTPVRFATFCPAAIAAIRRIPTTIEDRSIPARLQRAQAGAGLVKLRAPGARQALRDIARKFCRWRQDGPELTAEPMIPPALNDREADISVPLLSIAEAAGPEWAERARAALIEVFGLRAEAEGAAETGALLLVDIKAAFDAGGTKAMASEQICEYLAAREDRPWPEWKNGKPITKAQLARALAPFGIKPRTIRLPSGATPKGYHVDDFADAWGRYVKTPQDPIPPRDPPFKAPHRHNGGNQPFPSDSETPHNEACGGSKTPEKPQSPAACGGVAFWNRGAGGNGVNGGRVADGERDEVRL
jgi:putative DNA primase/helicase